MIEIDKKKSEIRKKYLILRKNIVNKELKSEIIFSNLIQTEEYKNAKIIALYKSLETEVNTTKLIDYSINNGKVVALPRVVNNELMFYKISINDKLEKSKFGVYEPISNNENIINKDEIDLIIVPGICFDEEMNRLGFGKGFYDRYLYNCRSKFIGICFEEQILYNKILPVTKYDVKMPKIITDKKVFSR